MDYGKAKINKDDFLADMNATYDKSYDQWLLSESKRIIRNRFILYGVAIAYFLSLILFALIEILLWEGSAYDLGYHFGGSVFAYVFVFFGLLYCMTKISKTNDLKRERAEMEKVFGKKYIARASESNYLPTAVPEKLAAEKNKIGRAVLRSGSLEEANSIIANEKDWRNESTYGALLFFFLVTIFNGWLLILFIFIVYYLIWEEKRVKAINKAKLLVIEKFGTSESETAGEATGV